MERRQLSRIVYIKVALVLGKSFNFVIRTCDMAFCKLCVSLAGVDELIGERRNQVYSVIREVTSAITSIRIGIVLFNSKPRSGLARVMTHILCV